MISTTVARRCVLTVRAAVVVLAVGFLLGALAWRQTGGRWYDVRTPSMGRAAPVGTLLLTRPVAFDDVRVGDFITFHAPPSGEVFSHRVVAVTPAGLRTRGDINGVTDPWTLTSRDLIGKVQHRWWGCGWVLRAVPLLLLALGVLWFLTSFFRPALRAPARVMGSSLAFAAVAGWLRPWTGMIKLGASMDGKLLLVRGVSTGVLPISVADKGGGRAVRLVSGQVAEVPVVHRSAHGAYDLSASLALSFWWWVAIAAVTLVPTMWTSLVGLAPVEAEPAWDVLAEVQPYRATHAVRDGAERRSRPYAYRPTHAAPDAGPPPEKRRRVRRRSRATYIDFEHEQDLLWLA